MQAPVHAEARLSDEAVEPQLGTIAAAETESTILAGQSLLDAPENREVPPAEDPARSEGDLEIQDGGAASPVAEAGVSAQTNSDEPAAAIEEALIEIWRPRPPPHRQRHTRPVARAHSPARTGAAAEGEARPDRQDHTSDRAKHRRHRPGSPAPSPHTAAEPGAQAESPPQKSNEEASKFRHGRGPRRPFDGGNRPESGAGRRGRSEIAAEARTNASKTSGGRKMPLPRRRAGSRPWILILHSQNY